MQSLVPVDHSALRTNQSLVILLPVLAFLFNLPWLVGLAAVVMLVGSFALKTPGFGFVYTTLLKPAGLVKPDVVQDNREPHLFAQGMGGVFLAVSCFLLYAGLAVAGWALAWLVVALAALNLFGGFCAGCAIYYWLNRLHFPGFVKSPPAGSFPGMRPGKVSHE
ncbi:MAG TPA: DUF4395 domain-containing protein [Anaerolinea sp.]|nr:DUF4395 domain-containing protein [Anaerolinea sp.]